ncbi:MAG: putative antitoxin of bacterial toxin-antitoxin system, YdaS/YdaT [Gammaproteobacteria bacterium]|jgi:DNA-binding transcriptional regulator YdaS (Cro superfamily)|nr:putative antitoxin of bacterial toxin-antitoxin system, YdaS/YdaT [Gammaproteobacteria bacterium]
MQKDQKNKKRLLAIDKAIQYLGSQEALVKALGVNRRTIYTWSVGTREISMTRIAQIVKLTNGHVTYEDFFTTHPDDD